MLPGVTSRTNVPVARILDLGAPLCACSAHCPNSVAVQSWESKLAAFVNKGFFPQLNTGISLFDKIKGFKL
jgi:hypothetical protein